jgi:hypothetical protein
MKELIGIAILIVGLVGGTSLFREIHNNVRKEALLKAGRGLPPLSPFARSLTRKKEVRK